MLLVHRLRCWTLRLVPAWRDSRWMSSTGRHCYIAVFLMLSCLCFRLPAAFPYLKLRPLSQPTTRPCAMRSAQGISTQDLLPWIASSSCLSAPLPLS